MAKLVFPVGIPGSGKSTWARTLLGHGKYAIVSSDDIRREQWGTLRAAHDVDPEEKKRRNGIVWEIFYKRIEDSLRHAIDVYADGTNLRQAARQRLSEVADRLGAQTHVIVFDNPTQALARNLERPHDLIVPDDVMEKFLTQYETAFQQIKDEEPYDSTTIIQALR